MPSSYDVVIAGAGPAGLLLASYLSPKLRVLVFDRGVLGSTTKFWLTSAARLARHDLQANVLFRCTRGSIGSFLGGYAVAEGDFAVVDEHRLLKELVERCRLKEVVLVEKCELRSLYWQANFLEIETSRDRYRARLLVDATGGASPIASTFRQHRLDGFFSVYGGHLENIELRTQEIIGAHVLRLGYPVPIFELFPTGPSSAFVVIFYATRRLESLASMRNSFEDHIRSNPFFALTAETKEVEGKMGGIPIGRLRRRALPGIFPFGEARLIQSPLIGAAFNEVLEGLPAASEAVAAALVRGTGIAQVQYTAPVSKIFNDWIQHRLVAHLLEGTLEEYHRIVRLLEELGPATSYRLFCSTMTADDLPSLLRAYLWSRRWRVTATESGL